MREKFYLEVKSISAYNNSFELLVKDLHQYKKQGYRIALLSGSRTRAERLAKDLQEEGLAAFYGQDYDREICPGEIMVVYGHAKKGFEYPLIKFAVMTESDIFGQEQKKKRKKITVEAVFRILRSFLSAILLSMKSMALVFTEELKKLK